MQWNLNTLTRYRSNHKYDQSLRCYQKAYDFSYQYLGQENHVSQNLKKVFDTAKDTIHKKLSKLKKDEKVKKGAATQKNKEVKEKKDFILKRTPLNEKRTPTESRAKMRPHMGSSSATIKKDDGERHENNKNVLQKPGLGMAVVNEGIPKVDRKQHSGEAVPETKRSDSRDDRLINGSASDRQQNDSHSNIRKSPDKGRDERERRGNPQWDGMLSSKMEDSDRGDPDEMGEEHSE
jgi:hypothetical protein